MRPALPALACLSLLVSCAAGDAGDDDSALSDDDSSPPEPEPLDLPEDPGEWGVPVGMTTLTWEGLDLEIWYPAPDAAASSAPWPADFDPFIPAEVLELIPDLSLPPVDSRAVRDAPLRVPVPGEEYPVVVFSHGFGGVRIQSLDYAAHLASRGYVVVATDHRGRSMTDLLPCLFVPALPGCDLSGMLGEDPAVDDVPLVVDWIHAASSEGFLAAAIDPERLALSGHSAGGGVIEWYGQQGETPFAAYLGMATAPAVTEAVPAMLLGGTCDPFATPETLASAAGEIPIPDLVLIHGAGHLAFSDYCALELDVLAETWLLPRDDVNPLLVDQLLALATDGCDGAAPPPGFEDCPESYRPLAESFPIVRHYTTAFLDEHLRGTGPGVVGGVYDGVTVE